MATAGNERADRTPAPTSRIAPARTHAGGPAARRFPEKSRGGNRHGDAAGHHHRSGRVASAHRRATIRRRLDRTGRASTFQRPVSFVRIPTHRITQCKYRSFLPTFDSRALSACSIECYEKRCCAPVPSLAGSLRASAVRCDITRTRTPRRAVPWPPSRRDLTRSLERSVDQSIRVHSSPVATAAALSHLDTC